MAQSMQEIHEQVRTALLDTTQKIKDKVDEKRKDIQFVVGDMVMVHLNKARLQKGVPSKLQMRRVGPCKVLAKYGINAYKVDLPGDMAFSPIFNVEDLVQYKGTLTTEDIQVSEVSQALSSTLRPSLTNCTHSTSREGVRFNNFERNKAYHLHRALGQVAASSSIKGYLDT